MLRIAALPLVLLAVQPFHASVGPLPGPVRTQLTGEFWHAGCPVPLSSLRLLTVSHWDFAGSAQTGALVVNRSAAVPLARVFAQLYRLRFPIRHMRFGDFSGP